MDAWYFTWKQYVMFKDIHGKKNQISKMTLTN